MGIKFDKDRLAVEQNSYLAKTSAWKFYIKKLFVWSD